MTDEELIAEWESAVSAEHEAADEIEKLRADAESLRPVGYMADDGTFRKNVTAKHNIPVYEIVYNAAEIKDALERAFWRTAELVHEGEVETDAARGAT